MKDLFLLRIEAPNFVAGATFTCQDERKCWADHAPILRWLTQYTVHQALFILQRKEKYDGWRYNISQVGNLA